MRAKALLVGFTYSGDKKLPGIAVDLYIVYSFLVEQGWKPEEITILTDIEKDEQTEILKKAIADRTVNVNILSFIEEAKRKDQYIKYRHQSVYNNFRATLEFCKGGGSNKTENFFFYYTGHSQEGNIILPNGVVFPFNGLKEYTEGNFKSVLTVLDSCGGSINLPFSLKEDIYRFNDTASSPILYPFPSTSGFSFTGSLSYDDSLGESNEDNKRQEKEQRKEREKGERKEWKEQSEKERTFLSEDFLSISSCLENEETIASRGGSFFTKTLFEILKEKNIHIRDILYLLKNRINIEYHKNYRNTSQTVNISASFPDIYMIPSWMYGMQRVTVRDRKGFLTVS